MTLKPFSTKDSEAGSTSRLVLAPPAYAAATNHQFTTVVITLCSSASPTKSDPVCFSCIFLCTATIDQDLSTTKQGSLEL